jgi:EAL domain-containing protein (putative c-di-GMP-specific phosphodiesterase class I)
MVVEGVENREQFDTLHTMGFDSLQGYFLSKPLPARDVPRLFEDFAPIPRSRRSSA